MVVKKSVVWLALVGAAAWNAAPAQQPESQPKVDPARNRQPHSGQRAEQLRASPIQGI